MTARILPVKKSLRAQLYARLPWRKTSRRLMEHFYEEMGITIWREVECRECHFINLWAPPFGGLVCWYCGEWV